MTQAIVVGVEVAFVRAHRNVFENEIADRNAGGARVCPGGVCVSVGEAPGLLQAIDVGQESVERFDLGGTVGFVFTLEVAEPAGR